MRPANARQAAAQTRALLARTLPGSRAGTVRAHLARAERIGAAIYRRFQVGPYRAQAKHFRWYLDIQTRQYQPATRYRHWLTVRAVAAALDKEDDWGTYLRGPWLRPTGDNGPLKPGRPAKRPFV